jgi:hypothetical protein
MINRIKKLTGFIGLEVITGITLPVALFTLILVYKEYDAFGLLLIASLTSILGFIVKTKVNSWTTSPKRAFKYVLLSFWISSLFTVSYIAMVSLKSLP